jgi:hypothetical protein
MKKNQTIPLVIATAFSLLLVAACNDAPAKEEAVKEAVATPPAAVTKPNLL